MKACPTAAIQIDFEKGEKGKRILKDFVVDHGLCCFCGLCEESCNFAAIKMDTAYEFSTENKDDLIWHTDKLQEMGRNTPYTPKPKKKPVAKPAAPKPKPEGETKPEAKPETNEETKTEAPKEETNEPETEKPVENKEAEQKKVDGPDNSDKPTDKDVNEDKA
jgi:ferredoxin